MRNKTLTSTTEHCDSIACYLSLQSNSIGCDLVRILAADTSVRQNTCMKKHNHTAAALISTKKKIIKTYSNELQAAML